MALDNLRLDILQYAALAADKLPDMREAFKGFMQLLEGKEPEKPSS